MGYSDRDIFLIPVSKQQTEVPHPDLIIVSTPGKGRAIATTSDLNVGIIVEEAPVIPMSAEDRKLLDQTLLHDYIFEWNPEETSGCCMALGWIPLFNHSYRSNCEYVMDYDAQIMRIETIRPVTAHEELTINYNGDWDDQTPVWFDVVE
jgi:hypothetical protein